MSSKRDTFVLKASYFSAFRHKLNFEQKGRLLEAIYAYHLGEDYQSLLNDAAVDMAFSFIQEFAEMCKRNYDEISQKNSANASKRWQKDTKDATASDRIQSHNTDAKRCLTDTDTDTDTNSDTDSLLKRESVEKKVATAPTRSRFVKPSIDEVKAYAKDMGYYGFNADRFQAYYESNGWKVGRNPMKDWRAAVRNWHAKDKAEAAPKMQPTYDELHPIGDFSNEYTNV